MAKTKTTKFYTVAGFSRIGGCIVPSNYAEVFTSRSDAAKFVAKEINDVIDDENSQNPDDQIDPVTAKDCKDGYRLCAYNDRDDIVCLVIVEHVAQPIHAVVTFDQDDRTLNITTVKDRKEAQARVAECAKAYLEDRSNYPEYVNVDRHGNCDIEADELTDSEPYVQVQTTGGNFTAWTAIEIPVFGKADIDVQ